MDPQCNPLRVALARIALGVRHWGLLVVLLLSACGSTVASGAPASTAAPRAADPLLTATPTAVEETDDGATVTPVPATATATPSPVPTSTPTATPFMCPTLDGTLESGTLQSQAMGEELRYLVHLPPCYDAYPETAFPVLYLLHGWPLSESHWLELGVATVADDWVSRKIAGPFIIVLPGAGSDGRYVHSSGGDWSFEGAMVNELIPLIDASYHTLRAPGGRAIGGISRGGVWALEIALRHQDLFGSVGGHSPALALNNPLPQYDPFLLVNDGTPQIRLYLDAGDQDWARASTMRLYDALLAVGANVHYETHPGAHVDELWRGGMLDYVAFYTALWPTSYDVLPVWTPVVAAETATPAP